MVRCYIRQKSAKAFHAALGYWCHYGVGGTGWVQCCLLGVGLLFVLGEAGGAGIKVGLHEAEFCSSLYFLTAVTKFFSPWGLCFLSNDGEVVRIPVRNSLSQGPGHRPFPATQLPVTQSSCVEMASELSRFQRSCFISSWQPEPGRGGVSPGLGCRGPPGTRGDPRLCRLDWLGLGVLGTGGGMLSGFAPTSGLGGGIRFLWGSGGPLLWPAGGTGNLPGPLGGVKGLADVALPPGGKIGGRLPPDSEEQEKSRKVRTLKGNQRTRVYCQLLEALS